MKIKRFQKLLREKNIDAALLYNYNNKDCNLFYFIGIDLDYTFLILSKKGNPILITSKLEYGQAQKYAKVRNIRIFNKPAFEYISKFVKRRGPKIGINKSVVSLNEFKTIKKYFKKKFVDINSILLEQRRTKLPDEVRNIKSACRITDSIFGKCVRNFNFKTEKDVVDFLRKEAEKKGCTLAFEPMVASGFVAGMGHYRWKKVKLRKGFCIIDFGVNYKGYLSDLTRTVYLGRPTKHEVGLYNLLLETQKQAINKIRIGTEVADIMDFVQKSLGDHGKKPIHGLGHGIGVQIHERPHISTYSKEKFQLNDLFTIEPGIYVPGKFGMRIEDDILLTEKGPIILTKASRELKVIK